MNWTDAQRALPPKKMQTLCYGPDLGFLIAMFSPYPGGGGSWEEDGDEVWFAGPDQITHWCELVPPDSA